jgi:hypothetical protein
MPRAKPKAEATPPLPDPDPNLTLGGTADRARTLLWQIANDVKQSGTARVSALRILLHDSRERDGGATALSADLDKRARALLRRVAN